MYHCHLMLCLWFVLCPEVTQVLIIVFFSFFFFGSVFDFGFRLGIGAAIQLT